MPATTRKALATSAPHWQGGGQRSWRTVLYAPTGSYKSYRVQFKEPDANGRWDWTGRNAATEAEAREIYAQVERALADGSPLPAAAPVAASHTFGALRDDYLDELRARGRAQRTVEGRESVIRAHVIPVLGETGLVRDWRAEGSRRVMAKAAETCESALRLRDVRAVLVQLRNRAWKAGWLQKGIDPLDGVEAPKTQELHGAGTGYVPPSARPEPGMVAAMVAACTELGPQWRMPLFGLKVQVAAYGGLRLGEQHGLRVWDLDVVLTAGPDGGEPVLGGSVFVNGSWTQPRAKDSPQPFRGPVKNHRLHEVPLPGSVMAQLLVRAREVLGLPADASVQTVQAAIRRERARRGQLVGRADRWWAWQPEDLTGEAWLFVDTSTGLPPRTEYHNHVWHKARRAAAKAQPVDEWPLDIPYRNLRHFAATHWWHDTCGYDWEVVAAFLGDELTTVLSHYVRAGADALAKAVRDMAGR